MTFTMFMWQKVMVNGAIKVAKKVFALAVKAFPWKKGATCSADVIPENWGQRQCFKMVSVTAVSALTTHTGLVRRSDGPYL